jgi:hypothetical protein
MGWCKLRWCTGLGNCCSMRVCSAIAPVVYGAEVKFGIEKLDTVCVYPYPNMLAIVCCGILKVGVKLSVVVWL